MAERGVLVVLRVESVQVEWVVPVLVALELVLAEPEVLAALALVGDALALVLVELAELAGRVLAAVAQVSESAALARVGLEFAVVRALDSARPLLARGI